MAVSAHHHHRPVLILLVLLLCIGHLSPTVNGEASTITELIDLKLKDVPGVKTHNHYEAIYLAHVKPGCLIEPLNHPYDSTGVGMTCTNKEHLKTSGTKTGGVKDTKHPTTGLNHVIRVGRNINGSISFKIEYTIPAGEDIHPNCVEITLEQEINNIDEFFKPIQKEYEPTRWEQSQTRKLYLAMKRKFGA